MKFTCQKDELLSAVNSAIKAVSSKASLPSLECFHIIADEKITISAHDMKTSIKSTFEANIFENGSLLLNASLFSNMLKKMPNGEVSFTTTDDLCVQISCGKTVFDITAIDDQSFPKFTTGTRENSLTILGSKLKTMINQTKFAKSDNESKIVHTGFLFEVDHNLLTMVTVDGYRVAVRKEPLSHTSKDSFKFVVPGGSLLELEKLIVDDLDVTIFVDRTSVIFEIENVELTTRIIEGDFIDYRKSIPSEFTTIITCDTHDLKQSIDRVSLLINERTRTPVRFNFEPNLLKLSCITTLGKSYDECEFGGTAEPFEIGFNNKYLLDALSACPSAKANLKFSGLLNPLIITPHDESDEFLYLTLPVRLKTDD